MKNHKNSRGQELVEFALVASIVLIFLFGIIDWGIAFLNHETLAQRAAWAARYVSTGGSEGEATNIVMMGSPTGTSGYTPIGMGGATVSYSYPESVDPGGFTGVPASRQYVVVTISGYSYQMFTPFIGQLINTSNIVASHPMED